MLRSVVARFPNRLQWILTRDYLMYYQEQYSALAWHHNCLISQQFGPRSESQLNTISMQPRIRGTLPWTWRMRKYEPTYPQFWSGIQIPRLLCSRKQGQTWEDLIKHQRLPFRHLKMCMLTITFEWLTSFPGALRRKDGNCDSSLREKQHEWLGWAHF